MKEQRHSRTEWIQSYLQDSNKFSSLSLFAKLKIKELCENESIRNHMPRTKTEQSRPQPTHINHPTLAHISALFKETLNMNESIESITDRSLRAAVCIDLLNKIAANSKEMSKLVKVLTQEICKLLFELPKLLFLNFFFHFFFFCSFVES